MVVIQKALIREVNGATTKAIGAWQLPQEERGFAGILNSI
jgi:hypothetical protein